jgi:polyphosphate kinase
LKTHAKLLLVTRRETPRKGTTLLRRYAHLSTGNYNPRTARLYTDVGYLTADPELTADVDAVFLKLSSLAPIAGHRRLLTAPTQLHARMLELLRKVSDSARAGESARVVVKVNSLTDPALTDALVEAGQAGAQVDLVVRGSCILRPGVPGVTENIRVRSVIGRFLEHTRVFYFRWGDAAAPEEELYLSSADWMSRNMLRRVEVAWPILDPLLRQRVIDECITPYLLDEQDAWELQSSGDYLRTATQGPSAQQALMRLHGTTAS